MELSRRVRKADDRDVDVLVDAPRLVATARSRLLRLGLSLSTMFELSLATSVSQAQMLRNPPTAHGPIVWENDYSNDAKVGATSGLKNIPLTTDGSAYVHLGASLRERFEHFTNPNLGLGPGAAVDDDAYLLHRLLVHPSEPFFVKNLENVQGDERDVIMISVGYAKNAQGYMAMRFGPLGAQGGERRLNVLISRAKRRCEVYASITDEDIDLERGKGAGILAFKLFLHYARTGRLSIAQATGRDMDSVFEEQVATALQAKRYQVHPQVGIAGFFIDLAVSDPERPGRYLIGIACDGASYHSSRSARDRDRLLQAVLEDHGWIIHRTWSTDWFQRPQEQLERTVAAIEAAKAELDERMERGHAAHRSVPIEIVTVDRESTQPCHGRQRRSGVVAS